MVPLFRSLVVERAAHQGQASRKLAGGLTCPAKQRANPAGTLWMSCPPPAKHIGVLPGAAAALQLVPGACCAESGSSSLVLRVTALPLQVSLSSGSGARRLAEARCRANIQLLLVQVWSMADSRPELLHAISLPALHSRSTMPHLSDLCWLRSDPPLDCHAVAGMPAPVGPAASHASDFMVMSFWPRHWWQLPGVILSWQACGEVYATHAARLPQPAVVTMLNMLQTITAHARDLDSDVHARHTLAAAQAHDQVCSRKHKQSWTYHIAIPICCGLLLPSVKFHSLLAFSVPPDMHAERTVFVAHSSA